jgi:hypothetical protein
VGGIAQKRSLGLGRFSQVETQQQFSGPVAFAELFGFFSSWMGDILALVAANPMGTIFEMRMSLKGLI